MVRADHRYTPVEKEYFGIDVCSPEDVTLLGGKVVHVISRVNNWDYSWQNQAR